MAKYPPNVCPRFITKLALHLQDNKAFIKPKGSPFISDYPDVSNPSDFTNNGKSDFVMVDHRDIPRSKQVNQRRNEKMFNPEKVWSHLDRIQAALNQANDAVEASQCDHGSVQVSLLKVQSALDALAQDLPRSSNPGAGNSFQKGHKRSTSIAYEALAFQ